MIELTYTDFISKIYRKELFVMKFSVSGYAHYNSCIIQTVYESRPNIYISVYSIFCILTKDETEMVSFRNKFKENYKLFYLGRKGSFTLKDIWDRIIIEKIEYY